jgi:hypothetical protein
MKPNVSTTTAEAKCKKHACAFQRCFAKYYQADPVEQCRYYFEAHQDCVAKAKQTIKPLTVG